MWLLVITESPETTAFQNRPTELRLNKRVDHKLESISKSLEKLTKNSEAQAFYFPQFPFLKT